MGYFYNQISVLQRDKSASVSKGLGVVSRPTTQHLTVKGSKRKVKVKETATQVTSNEVITHVKTSDRIRISSFNMHSLQIRIEELK